MREKRGREVAVLFLSLCGYFITGLCLCLQVFRYGGLSSPFWTAEFRSKPEDVYAPRHALILAHVLLYNVRPHKQSAVT